MQRDVHSVLRIPPFCSSRPHAHATVRALLPPSLPPSLSLAPLLSRARLFSRARLRSFWFFPFISAFASWCAVALCPCVRVGKPGAKLDKSDEACLSNCVERFLDVGNLVVQRLQESRRG